MHHHTHHIIKWIGAVLCISLLGACASTPMQTTSLINAPQTNTALVTFIRPAIFFGDGMSLDIWDGEHFLGALGSGKLIQYEATPGEHLFLANAENWSYASANLLPGKRYFIKATIFPGVISGRVALGAVPKTDERIDTWLSDLKPMSATQADKQTRESEKKDDVNTAIQDFKDGKVTSFATLKPEDGL